MSAFQKDEPFDHRSLSRHGRADSSANLLQSESSTAYERDRESSGYISDKRYTDIPYDPYAEVSHPPDETLNEANTYAYDPTHVTKPYQDLEFQDMFAESRAQPMLQEPTAVSRVFGTRGQSLAQRIDDKKRGIARQRYPFVVWALSLAMSGVFIYELVVNAKAQGTPVSFKPVVNPMLGPSSSALINVGARFPPCMKIIPDIPLSVQLPCLNDTANPPDRLCSLEDLCGFGGFHDKDPDQWWRFITPIFLHAGIIHFALNMLAQLTAAAEVEREMGSAGFLLLYVAAGIFGNVLGGNFYLPGVPSIGASGAIFGTVAVAWIDLFAHWRYHYRPVRRLIFMIIELIFGLAVGFIPFVDNFAHIGGFLMGLLVGMTLYPIISASRRHQIVTWSLRIAAIPIAVLLFVLLIRNFYTSDPSAACSWCRYISCFPSSLNNQCKGTGLSTSGSASL